MNPTGRRQSAHHQTFARALTAAFALVLSIFIVSPTVFTQGAAKKTATSTKTSASAKTSTPTKTSTAREHWISTWATAVVARNAPGQGGGGAAAPAGQQPAARGQGGQGQNAPAAQGQNAPAAPGRGGENAPAAQGRGGQPAAAPQPPVNFNNQTLRQIVHTSIGGSRVRVVLSNAFGTQPLPIDGAHVALHAKGSGIIPGSDRTLMFSGMWPATIPAGGVVFSDPVDLKVPPMSDLAIDLQFAVNTATWPSPLTMHNTALETNYLSPTGNFLGAPMFSNPTTTQNWFVISRVDVAAPASAATFVALGDSITDGTRSTPDTNNRWPDHLARKLASQPGGLKIGVIDLGIAGNRVLKDGAGVNALARLERDVLVQPSVKWVVFLEGINDVGLTRGEPQATPAELIAGHKQVIARLHERGIKVYGGTLLPFEGTTIANYYTEQGETTRQAVNQWIRTGKAYDGVIDFDLVMKDPASPKKMRAEYDGGDHLHPNDTGYKVMADAVYSVVFKGRPAVPAPAKPGPSTATR
jgi:lysophospholipase L1-like esterase